MFFLFTNCSFKFQCALKFYLSFIIWKYVSIYIQYFNHIYLVCPQLLITNITKVYAFT